MDVPGVDVLVLGETGVRLNGAPADAGAAKQRALLAALALHAGRPVRVDELVELLWGQSPPTAPRASLQSYVNRLRRLLGPDVVLTTDDGYRLGGRPEDVDARRFATAVTEVHRRLARPPDALPLPPAGLSGGEVAALAARLEGTLGLVRGTPYADLADTADVRAERGRLEELRLVATEDLAVLRLGLGDAAAVAADAEALAGAHPLRESVWAVLAVALARAGQQGAALEALRRVRSLLVEELGVDPGPGLRAVEAAVLAQPAELFRTPAGAVAATGQEPRAADGAGVPTPTSASPHGPRAGARPLPSWPLVGRDGELAALGALLAAAAEGVAGAASVVGEAGVGKSRLLQELATRAEEGGVLVLSGRCSQDDGAPPLWPWTSVVDGLAAMRHGPWSAVASRAGALAELLTGAGEGAATGEGAVGERAAGEGTATGGTAGAGTGRLSQFRLWDAVAGVLADAARVAPVLVVVDDLHWADASTLRLTRHLLAEADLGGVVLVVTRRPGENGSGPAAQLAEALGRRHALQLRLGGLAPDQAGALVAAVAGREVEPHEASRLHGRTDGNAFFLVELARSGAQGEVPSGVADVVAARVAALPAPVPEVLRDACVIGRSFDLPVLAAVTGRDEDSLVDALDAALAAGLITQGVGEGPETFRFAHALVRDALYERVPAARRARRHAAVARALEQAPGAGAGALPAEIARHWLAAGPSHAARAWRAATAAAGQARRLGAPDETAGLLAAAVRAQHDDPDASDLERYELVLAWADAAVWAADRAAVKVAVGQATALADRLGDVRLLARAAVVPMEGVVWHPQEAGEVDDRRIATLRRALRELPPDEDALRCRVLLGLAVELFYARDATAERRALVEEGLAVARRLGDPRLRVWACITAFIAIFSPAQAERRVTLASEALDAARAIGDEPGTAIALTLRAIAEQEVGRIDAMRENIVAARQLCDRLRLMFPLVVLGWLEVPWLALAGDVQAALALWSRTVDLHSRTSMPQADASPIGALITVRMAAGDVDDALVDAVEGARGSYPRLPTGGVVLGLMCRAGRLDDARARPHADIAAGDGDLEWLEPVDLALAAEAAFQLGDAALAARVYARLAPYEGRPVCAGSGSALGPVDRALALCAATTGELALATRHADAALALCDAWRIPVVAAWLADERRAAGF